MNNPSNAVRKSHLTLERLRKGFHLIASRSFLQRALAFSLIANIFALLFIHSSKVDGIQKSTPFFRNKSILKNQDSLHYEILPLEMLQRHTEDSENPRLVANGQNPFDLVHAKPRVYPISFLKGHLKNSIYPPGFHLGGRFNRTMLDVGANNGDDYSLEGARKGYTVLAFEPSPSLLSRFVMLMLKHEVRLSVVNTESGKPIFIKTEDDLAFLDQNRQKATDSTRDKEKLIISHPQENDLQVYLFPIALSNRSGMFGFHEFNCTSSLKCGKNNFLNSKSAQQSKLTVPTFRLDDIKLPIDESTIWFLKIDVEGHERMVLEGARRLLEKGYIQYIAIEFSSNGRKGTKWGVDLLIELYSSGFVCFHLRGFGDCHKEYVQKASFECNYPFSLLEDEAPSFLTYSKVFEFSSKKKRMSDLICKRRNGISGHDV